MQVLLAVLTVAAVGTVSLGQQVDAFVVADHLGAKAGFFRSLADIHRRLLPCGLFVVFVFPGF